MATKGEIVEAVAAGANVSKAEAERAITCFFECVAEEIEKDEKVSWPGFGTFSRSERAARMGRNPQTGEALEIGASRSVKLTVSKQLKVRLSYGLS